MYIALAAIPSMKLFFYAIHTLCIQLYGSSAIIASLYSFIYFFHKFKPFIEKCFSLRPAWINQHVLTVSFLNFKQNKHRVKWFKTKPMHTKRMHYVHLNRWNTRKAAKKKAKQLTIVINVRVNDHKFPLIKSDVLLHLLRKTSFTAQKRRRIEINVRREKWERKKTQRNDS